MAAIKLTNPLDKFQTYSTHFVMLACRSTESADLFTDAAKNVEALDKINNAKFLGAPVQTTTGATDVFLVIDTRRFSQFTVESVKYDVHMNGFQRGASVTNFATDFSMVILDSVGISFANFMQDLMDNKMKTNFEGLTFLLKLIFVGHTEKGESITVHSETIPLLLARMDVNLDFAKGVYNMEFMPNTNFNPSRYERMLTIAQSTTFKADASNSLGGVIKSFEDKLNFASNKYFHEVQDVKPVGREVNYSITIPDSWKEFKYAGPNVGDATEIKHPSKNKPEESVPSTISKSQVAVEPGTSITKALDKIFESVKEIIELGIVADKKTNNSTVKFYKHIVGITSNDKTATIHVDVIEFEIANKKLLETEEIKTTTNAQLINRAYGRDDQGNKIRNIPSDYIEYDFIFSGLNKDILTFDLKIEQLNFLLAGNLKTGDGVTREVSNDNGSVKADKISRNEELNYVREFDPLIMPLNSDQAVKNFSQYSSLVTRDAASQVRDNAISQQYHQNLSMFYAGSAAATTITIKGNPDIMHKFNIGSFLPTRAPGEDTGSYREKLMAKLLRAGEGGLSSNADGRIQINKLSSPTHVTGPVFAKINVYGPNVDPLTNAIIPNSTYASSVLSDNFYSVFKVTNIISNGVFTQELELRTHTIFGAGA